MIVFKIIVTRITGIVKTIMEIIYDVVEMICCRAFEFFEGEADPSVACFDPDCFSVYVGGGIRGYDKGIPRCGCGYLPLKTEFGSLPCG